MSPLIIKTSLMLMPPMAPLSKEPGSRGRGPGTDSSTCSYHDKISEDERPVGDECYSILLVQSRIY